MQRSLLILFFVLLTASCTLNGPRYVVITATATGIGSSEGLTNPTSGLPTPDPTRVTVDGNAGNEYVVQPGDTLSAIAAANGVSVETLLSVNNITDPNVISVGQEIILPAPPDKETNSFKIIPDGRLVRGPGSRSFDIVGFINQQPGYIRVATDTVDDTILTASQIIERVSLEFSVDARLLLALVEYNSSWLSRLDIDDAQKTYPMIGGPSSDGIDRSGLYLQLSWAANQLNRGYYGWKEGGVTTLEFEDKTRLLYSRGLNAGTVALQYFLSLNNTYPRWVQQVAPEGFYQLYLTYFGNPFSNSLDLLVPGNLVQPTMEFPFSPGQTWFFTGGPHGAWGNGSAWGAIDFAPPDDRPDGSPSCYISEFWATAVTSGIIARSDNGVVILDLDGDGDEATGWSILYLHIASEGRVEAGKYVNTGDLIGHPSCEGGFSNATHLHIARRYNGEWIPVTCDLCRPGYEIPPFVLSGWTSFGLQNQEYQGYMTKNADQRRAEQGRLTLDNRVSR
jgi:LasA protease